jgi:hypothetical protein
LLLYVRDWHSVSKTPHIAILDPETGERKWFHEGFLSAAEACKELSTFLNNNPWDVENGSIGHHTDPTTLNKRYEEMTEEEQMAWVIEASLREQRDPSQPGSESIQTKEPILSRRSSSQVKTNHVKRTSSSSLSKLKKTAAVVFSDDESSYDSDFIAVSGSGSNSIDIIGSDSDDEFEVSSNKGKRNHARRTHKIIDLDESDELEEVVRPPRPKRAKSQETASRLQSKQSSVAAATTTPSPPPPPSSSSSHVIQSIIAPVDLVEVIDPEEEIYEEDDSMPEGKPDCTLQVCKKLTASS